MSITYFADDLYEVTLAFLNPLDPNSQDKARYFSLSEQFIVYLKNRPNQRFSLLEKRTGEIITLESAKDAYGSEYGDVFYGDEVYYDPIKDQILHATEIHRVWSG